MKPNSDEHVEDVIRGIRVIAKALRATPAQVHELRARQGLPTFLSGLTVCRKVVRAGVGAPEAGTALIPRRSGHITQS